MGRELFELVRVRLLLFRREPEALFWVIVFPLLLAAVLGLAFRDRADPKVVAGVLGSPDGGDAPLEQAADLDVRILHDRAEAERQLAAGILDILVDPGPPLTLRLDQGREGSERARLRVESALQRRAGRVDVLEIVVEEVREVGSRYVDWLFPGLIGMNLMGTGIWLVGLAVTDERRRRLTRRLLVTPVHRLSLLLAHLLARFVFLVLEVGVLLLFARLVLDIPFRGSVMAFALLSVGGGMSFAGLGILVGARPRTVEGVMGLMNVVMMPMWLGSGVFFSYHRFHAAMIPVVQVLPLTALNDGLRAVMLEGAGVVEILPRLAIVLAWGAASLALGLWIFRWR